VDWQVRAASGSTPRLGAPDHVTDPTHGWGGGGCEISRKLGRVLGVKTRPTPLSHLATELLGAAREGVQGAQGPRDGANERAFI
jgi:hypothetical protein